MLVHGHRSATSRHRSVSVAISRWISSKHKKRWPGLFAVMAWGMAKNNHRIHGFITCYNYTNYQSWGYIYIYIFAWWTNLPKNPLPGVIQVVASWEIPERNGALKMDFPWPGLITGENFWEMVRTIFFKNKWVPHSMDRSKIKPEFCWGVFDILGGRDFTDGWVVGSENRGFFLHKSHGVNR
jgi:hypothetical protein